MSPNWWRYTLKSDLKGGDVTLLVKIWSMLLSQMHIDRISLFQAMMQLGQFW